MPIKTKSKTVVVKEHLRRVKVSKKNPSGQTIVDRHLRHIDGQYLDYNLIEETYKGYEKKKVAQPGKEKLLLPDEDKFDDYIAVWTDYFNKKLNLKSPIDPDMVKALIASESTFNPTAVNKEATGLTQVTVDTLEILQDLEGEVKEFVFKDIKKKDLKEPNVSVAVGVRWLAYKKQYANKIFKRDAISDEIIQVYKGILNDKSKKAKSIMEKYREFYGKLKNK
ncbi:MAG: transglycosylase SLT domain-containing protein [Bdellovibrio sp.]|nr:transglycosylase SLT domain-containing protein [Bdellovibrio sp.]